jgi:ubiquinone/menaquinone biosynthesis C-methylase UbiE
MSTGPFWEAIGSQLRHPSGIAGRVMGRIMRVANASPNRLAIRALALEADDDVLELGFGPGHGIALMAAQVTRGAVYGIDQSEDMLIQARRRNAGAARRGRVHLLLARFEKLPLRDRGIDKVLAVNVAYFWDDPPAVLREIARVLRPDGLISIYVTDASAMRRWKFADHRTHHLFDRQSLRSALRSGGFHDGAINIAEIEVAPGLPGLIATAQKH